jgi:hypothetical protein
MMGNMATLGEAYIEVHADTRPFAKELKRQIDTILKKIDATIGVEGVQVGAKLGQGLKKGLDDSTKDMGTGLGARIRTAFRRIGTEAAEEFRSSFDRLARSNFILFRVLGRSAQRIGALFGTVKRVGGEVLSFAGALLKANGAMINLGFQGIKSLLGFANNLSGSLTSAQQAGSQLVGALGSLATSAASGAIGLAAMAAAAVLLTSVLAALAAILIVAAAPFAQLLNFALLIPAALSVFLAIVAPLAIALQGLGDALELVFEKDPKKFAKGLAELSPMMRDLTLSLRTLLPLFNQIQRSVQKAFLAPILSTLVPTLKSIGPSIGQGLTLAARAMGVFVARAIALLETPAFKRFVEELFPAVAGMVETLADPLLRLMTALANATTAALPTVELLIGKLGGFIDSFATWLEGAITDGRFQKFLDDAIASAQAIWDLIKALIGLFAEMFAQTDEGGRKFLASITAAVNEFTKWLRSPDGKRALEDAVVLALAFGVAFGVALKIVRIIVSELSRGIRIAYALLNLIGIIKDRAPGVGTSLAHTDLDAPGYSGGGVVPYNQMALVHKGEPILDPANTVERNRSILADAGMLDILSQPNGTTIYIGGEKLYEHIDYRVHQSQRSTAQSITNRARVS